MSQSLSAEKLHFATKLAYGAGDFGPAITANILVFYLLFFLTDVAGIPAALAGSVLMIGKIFDAINDPIIGLLSDRTRSRWGRRLPWMLGGMIPFALLYAAQWLIPSFSEDRLTNQWGLFIYYVAVAMAFNLCYTTVNLPYTALTPELTQNYNERTRLNSFRFAFSIGGSILSLILYILIAAGLPDRPQQQFGELGVMISVLSISALLWSALRLQEKGKEPILSPSLRRRLAPLLMAAGITLISLAIARSLNLLGGSGFDYISFFLILLGLIWGGFGFTLRDSAVEEHLQKIENSPSPEAAESLPLLKQLKIAFSNRAFLFVIGIYLCSWLAVQLTASILVYFVVSWMGLGEQQSGTIALAVQGTALVMLFVWQALAQFLDKKVIYFLGSMVWMGAEAGLWLVQPGQVALLYTLAIFAGVGVSVAYLIPWSMIPDVVDLDELNTGKRREGVFYAFMVLLQKVGLALGLFLVGITLEASGFIARIPGEPIPVQPDSALWAIRFAVAPLPAFFLLGGLILAIFYPITRAVHTDIRQQLQARQQNNHI
ncbi:MULTISPECIES: MFS transporter [unclassified Synechocystis]|uniref:MFS transporter n=1 Tax=unclassified Synechocystis TaxID=2640012 RepID=UPI00041502F8|nr:MULTISPECIES: MFS transporter [unclassified Synechocystis]AIE75854.1 melibiose carrier protein [Synechocystis sp. PCC 6714]MCT0255216.1 MFS transporter [Synechocystis sp. CS-94]